jgi:hypothetical protein
MKGSLTAKQAVSQALAVNQALAPDTTANKSTVKKITKRKLTIGPTQNLSTMVDSMPTVQAQQQAPTVQVPTVQAQQQAPTVQVPTMQAQQTQAQQTQAQQTQAPTVPTPIYAESNPVKKLKRTLNIKK